MLNWLSARTRLAAGLVAIVGCMMLAAITLGLVPDRANIERQHRAELCETLAINYSVLANRNDISGIRQSLQTVINRHPEILSAGVRDRFGRMMVDVKDHDKSWPKDPKSQISDIHVQVPVFRGKQKFASVELKFATLEAQGIAGWIQHPWTLLMAFVNSACFVFFSLYLGFMLRQLNPSKAVPSHVRRALNNLAEGLMVLDVKGRMVLVNSAFEQIVGQAETKLLGKRPKIFQWLGEDRQVLTEYPWDIARTTGQPVLNTQVRLKAEDDRIIVFNANCAPISTAGNETSFGVMVSLEDITQIDEAKVQIQKSRDEAEAANRAKSDFLANMSHEIRTPMNAILGFTELLRRGMVESKVEAAEYLSTIHTSGSHLLDLINDILDLSKIESGKMEMELLPCSPYKLIHDVVSILSVRAKDKGLSLTVDPASRVPNQITTDPVRFRQIITNLVGNAIKFTEKGGVRIEAQAMPDGMLEIRIHDTGVGMTAAQMERIFNPFAQADSTVTRRFGGTGLGLSISRRIARALGGDLTVQSVPGKGSTFIAKIHLGTFDAHSLVEYRHYRTDEQLSLPTPKTAKRFQGERILAVDDGEANLRLIRLILSKANLQVDIARNGQQAIDLIGANNYAVVFMDMQMPILDGYSATRRLREMGNSVPIIALTAHALRGEEGKCLEAGCNAYLTKPINLDLLIDTVAQYLPFTECEIAPTPIVASEADSPPEAESMIPNESTQSPRVALRKKPGLRLVAPAQSPPKREKLYSKLPLEPNEVREIVCDFQTELANRLELMKKSIFDCNWPELARAAHWLKGAGGTVGFPEFVKPSAQLEEIAKVTQSADQATCVLNELDNLAAMIELPEGSSVPQTR